MTLRELEALELELVAMASLKRVERITREFDAIIEALGNLNGSQEVVAAVIIAITRSETNKTLTK
jgi:hypothetical protein